jgi:hypothetical protein
VLARGAEVVIAVAGMQVFSAGVTFDLVVRCRTRLPATRGHELHKLISGRSWGDDDGNADRRLLFGLEFADGRMVTTTTSPSLPWTGADDDEPVLNPSGGGGGDLAYDQRWWLSPVPPDGPLLLVCAWPAFGIPETQQRLDHLDLTSASRGAVVLWNPAPMPTSPGPPPAPSVPAGGWFSSAIGADPAADVGE